MHLLHIQLLIVFNWWLSFDISKHIVCPRVLYYEFLVRLMLVIKLSVCSTNLRKPLSYDIPMIIYKDEVSNIF